MQDAENVDVESHVLHEQQFKRGERAVLHGLVQSPECNGTEVVVVDYHEVNRKYRVLFKGGCKKNAESKHLQKVEVGCSAWPLPG